MKLPAFQFYPADWRKDPGIQALTYHQRGIWFEIICLMHESPSRGYLLLPNGNAMPDDALFRILGLDKQSGAAALAAIIECGVANRDPETEALINRRMIRDEELRRVRSECGKMGAPFGGLGGRPKGEVTAKTANKPQGVGQMKGQNNPPSSSPSSSSSKKPPLPPKAEVLPFESESFKAAWTEWKQHRSEIKKSLTPTSMERQLTKLKGMGEQRAIVSIQDSIANGWQGLFEPKDVKTITETSGETLKEQAARLGIAGYED
jgi:hypothetical protein